MDLAVRRTRRFARRQRSWFRRDPRIAWFDSEANPGSVLDPLQEAVAQAPRPVPPSAAGLTPAARPGPR